MKSRAAMLAGLLVSVMATASCENTTDPTPVIPGTPAGPSSVSNLLLPRLEGLWGGDLTLSAVAGGTGPARNAGAFGCVGAAFDGVIGEVNYNSLSITQSGTDLTAKLVSAGTGLACTYTGTIGSGNNLVLHAEVCTPKTLTIRCHPNPETGDRGGGDAGPGGVEPDGDLRATGAPVNVTRISGVAAHTYNIAGEGALVATHTFTNLTRR